MRSSTLSTEPGGGQAPSPVPLQGTLAKRSKKRENQNPGNSSSGRNTTRGSPYDADVDPVARGDKSKVKSLSSRTRQPINQSTDSLSSTRTVVPGRRERDRSLTRGESVRSSKRTPSVEPIEADGDPLFTGSIAVAQYARLQIEVEKLREQLQRSKKTIEKQSKVIDELRREVTDTNKVNQEQSTQVEKLKKQSKKCNELINNIESNLQCQICLEILSRPFTLSPCGHVFCQNCLQDWFRSAPPAEDEMYDDADPLALIYRTKTCPCCRTAVRSRPTQLFIIKSITSALNKVKPSGSRRNSPPPDPDPWAGIFPGPDDLLSTDEDEDETDEEDDDGFGWVYGEDGYGTDSDEEPYEGEYVPARWQPPSVHVEAADFLFDDLTRGDFKMLRRGATVQMIELFNMSYSHEEGLSISLDDGNRVYLGWNIRLHPSDYAGEEYVDYIVNDVFERGERWNVDERADGTWTAWRFVRESEEVTFDTTDSEQWEAYEDEGEGDE